MPMRLSRQRNGIAARRAILSKIPPRLYPRIGSDIRMFFFKIKQKSSENVNWILNMTGSDSLSNDQTESKFSFVLQWRHCNRTTSQNWRWKWTWIQAQVSQNVKKLLKLNATVKILAIDWRNKWRSAWRSDGRWRIGLWFWKLRSSGIHGPPLRWTNAQIGSVGHF